MCSAARCGSALLADIALCVHVPEPRDALKQTASRYALLATVDLLATVTACSRPRESQEWMRRMKLELLQSTNSNADRPLGD